LPAEADKHQGPGTVRAFHDLDGVSIIAGFLCLFDDKGRDVAAPEEFHYPVPGVAELAQNSAANISNTRFVNAETLFHKP